jgi:putative membrane protein
VRPDPYAWSVHGEALVAVAGLCGAYAWALRGRSVGRLRIVSFTAGAALLVAIAVTPLDALSFHLLSAHLLQNVVLAEWAPLLLVLAVPPLLASRLAQHRPLRRLTHPLVALFLWLATYFLWHLPAAYTVALEHPWTLLHLEHACYLAAGCLLWWPVIQDEPWRLGSGARAAYVFAAFVLASPLGLLLALLPEPTYSYYEEGPGLWGLSPLTDQQLAGVTMAVEQAIVFFAAFAVLFFRFLAEQEAEELPAT